MTFIDIATWTAGAVIAVGLIEWLKKCVPVAPKWVWLVTLPVVSGVGAYALWLSNQELSILGTAFGIWAVAQIGYQLIIRTVRKKLEG